jgi:DNA-binding transcriptional LysR family regulator
MVNSAQLARTDINLLVLFDVVLRERHLGRAAQRLNLTPSAISHALSRLRRVLHDPLFLRTPRGVVPTARALDLAEPVADILMRVGAIVSGASPFDAAHSTRRFIIGAPDAISAIFLPRLTDLVRDRAPGVSLGVREPFHEPTAMNIDHVWASVRGHLETRTIDIAVIPAARKTPRFALQPLFDTEFVIVARRGHGFLRRPTLEHYCEADHVVVSQIADAHGFVDVLLAKQRRSRRVALTVPSFMLALSLVATSDMLMAAPRNLVEVHAKRMGLAFVDAPVTFGSFDPVFAVTSQAALLDAGVAWLYALFGELGQSPRQQASRLLPSGSSTKAP